jgi:hypothetical protein
MISWLSPGLKLLETAWKFYHQGKKKQKGLSGGVGFLRRLFLLDQYTK